MKAVLISVRPGWCQRIFGIQDKKYELRKSKPVIQTPIKCFVYCTMDKWNRLIQMPDKSFCIYDGRDYGKYDKNLQFDGECNGKVIGEFVCDEIYAAVAHPSIFAGHPCYHNAVINESCVTIEQVKEYSNGKDVYGWHISDLVIYDEPKVLSEFYRRKGNDPVLQTLIRPPQSWCYVEELK